MLNSSNAYLHSCHFSRQQRNLSLDSTTERQVFSFRRLSKDTLIWVRIVNVIDEHLEVSGSNCFELVD